MPFMFTNFGDIFQRDISYALNNTKHNIDVYLNDLETCSIVIINHFAYLCVVSICCHHYRIRVNPHKCIFCMVMGRLTGFSVSKYHIMVDPFKVEEITQLPLLKKIRSKVVKESKLSSDIYF